MKILKFSAGWCNPCKAYAPIFLEFVKEHNIEYEEIDIESNPELATKYGVSSIPLTVFVKGDTIHKITGVMSKEKLENVYKSL